MIFQASLLIGFMDAAAKVMDAVHADLWIAPRGTVCFDFASTLDGRFRDIAEGVPGVETVTRLSVAFVGYRLPSGQQRTVVLIGADPNVGSGFPLPYLANSRNAIEPESVLVDEANARELGLSTLPSEIEINGLRAQVTGTVQGFSSFLGSPYVFSSYRDAERYSRLGPERAAYLAIRVAPDSDLNAIKSRLAAELPEVDVWTQAEFRRRSQSYWIVQTGAGAAILTAAVLAFLIGLVLVSQTIYASTMERLDEFATLKALGASTRYIVRILLVQALAFGIAGSIIGGFLAIPAVNLARGLVAWISTPTWLVLIVIPMALVMCALASVMSVRTALSVEPARVFRA